MIARLERLRVRATRADPAGTRLDRVVNSAAWLVLGFAVVEAAWLALAFIPAHREDFWIGMDYSYYRDVGVQWLHTGEMYLPSQLAGSYVMHTMTEVMYPPNALLLFVPFAVLPAVVWWVAPIAILAFVVAGWSPAPWARLAAALLLLYPTSAFAYVLGNSSIWTAAFLAAGLRWGWPVALLAIKPSIAPLGILLMRRRSAWLGAVVLAAASLVWLPLWFDYVVAMRNATVGWDWSAARIPLMLLPVVAWVGRRRDRSALELRARVLGRRALGRVRVRSLAPDLA